MGNAYRQHWHWYRHLRPHNWWSHQYTGCGFRNEFCTSRRLWCTRFYVAMHHVTIGPLTRVDDLPDRRTLRSTHQANCLVVPPVKLSTVGSRVFAFAVCGYTHLEYTTNWRRCGKFTFFHLPSTVKTFFRLIQTIISWRIHILTSSSKWSLHLGHLKNLLIT